jgi:hypothetical protein
MNMAPEGHGLSCHWPALIRRYQKPGLLSNPWDEAARERVDATSGAGRYSRRDALRMEAVAWLQQSKVYKCCLVNFRYCGSLDTHLCLVRWRPVAVRKMPLPFFRWTKRPCVRGAAVAMNKWCGPGQGSRGASVKHCEVDTILKNTIPLILDL